MSGKWRGRQWAEKGKGKEGKCSKSAEAFFLFFHVSAGPRGGGVGRGRPSLTFDVSSCFLAMYRAIMAPGIMQRIIGTATKVN